MSLLLVKLRKIKVISSIRSTLVTYNMEIPLIFNYFAFKISLLITSDVQTAAVAIIHSHLVHQKSIKVWIENYRSLLDCWMLWEQRFLNSIMIKGAFFLYIFLKLFCNYLRAHYDISRTKTINLDEERITFRCSFCGENILSKKKPTTSQEIGANVVLILKSIILNFYSL